MHSCPFTLGQLLAAYAVLQARGHTRLAALIFEHSRHHEPTTTERNPEHG